VALPPKKSAPRGWSESSGDVQTTRGETDDVHGEARTCNLQLRRLEVRSLGVTTAVSLRCWLMHERRTCDRNAIAGAGQRTPAGA
jgi:hypothetical protein